jgi:hypothetical protein
MRMSTCLSSLALGTLVGGLLLGGCGGTRSRTLDVLRLERASPPAVHESLPDLDQEEPTELSIRARQSSEGKLEFRLGFRSAIRNIGDGPLVVTGSRPDQRTPFMSVDQHIEREGAPERIVADVGRMQYAISSDHSHWHYLQFERYMLEQAELREAGGHEVLLRDQKTGFCLGDRYRVDDRTLPAAPAQPVFRGNCGRGQTGLLSVREGISVGYGDDYSAFLEGQDVPITDLPAGRYVLVHRVNVDQRLRELSYANDAASVLIELRWARSIPQMRVLAVCPDSDGCEDPSHATETPNAHVPVALAPQG